MTTVAVNGLDRIDRDPDTRCHRAVRRRVSVLTRSSVVEHRSCRETGSRGPPTCGGPADATRVSELVCLLGNGRGAGGWSGRDGRCLRRCRGRRQRGRRVRRSRSDPRHPGRRSPTFRPGQQGVLDCSGPVGAAAARCPRRRTHPRRQRALCRAPVPAIRRRRPIGSAPRLRRADRLPVGRSGGGVEPSSRR